MNEGMVDPKGLIEALLFVTDEVLSVARLADVAELSQTEVGQVLAELEREYESGSRGFVLRELAGGWRLFSHPAYADHIERLVLSWDARRLSQAALEVLAIVAYRQPCTRLQVNSIRGVNSEAALSSLTDKGLVVDVGRERGPGQPILYGTSPAFLERFGLRSLADLPPLDEFAPDEEARRRIAEGLATGVGKLSLAAGTTVEDAGEPIDGAVPADDPADVEAVD